MYVLDHPFPRSAAFRCHCTAEFAAEVTLAPAVAGPLSSDHPFGASQQPDCFVVTLPKQQIAHTALPSGCSSTRRGWFARFCSRSVSSFGGGGDGNVQLGPRVSRLFGTPCYSSRLPAGSPWPPHRAHEVTTTLPMTVSVGEKYACVKVEEQRTV